MLLLIS
ncbi:uncharacterized protein FFB20_01015 [Fusarium fujikuroi]